MTFTTIVPGCYRGRWTHIHFEVYPDAASATNVANQIATSQVAFPQDMLGAVYRDSAYAGSAENLSDLGGIDNDNAFSDGYALEMASFAVDPTSGDVGMLAVAVDAFASAVASSPGGPRARRGTTGSPHTHPGRGDRARMPRAGGAMWGPAASRLSDGSQTARRAGEDLIDLLAQMRPHHLRQEARGRTPGPFGCASPPVIVLEQRHDRCGRSGNITRGDEDAAVTDHLGRTVADVE